MDVNGESRLKIAIELTCWVGQHWFFSYVVALPSLIVWGLGIPFFAFIMLNRKKHTLMKVETKE
jgi:hypothetical protein